MTPSSVDFEMAWHEFRNFGAGGEACGYDWPERAVFKHPNKIPQH
jgi:hypothetical protein